MRPTIRRILRIRLFAFWRPCLPPHPAASNPVGSRNRSSTGGCEPRSSKPRFVFCTKTAPWDLPPLGRRRGRNQRRVALQYFPNKHALVLAVHHEAVRDGWQHVQAILDGPDGSHVKRSSTSPNGSSPPNHPKQPNSVPSSTKSRSSFETAPITRHSTKTPGHGSPASLTDTTRPPPGTRGRLRRSTADDHARSRRQGHRHPAAQPHPARTMGGHDSNNALRPPRNQLEPHAPAQSASITPSNAAAHHPQFRSEPQNRHAEYSGRGPADRAPSDG